jgi:hypothetical protein
VNALKASVVVDSTYAPAILIFRFTRWPTLAEQKALLKSIVTGRNRAGQSAVIDITSITAHLPDPDTLAHGLAQSQSVGFVLKRIACVVASPEQFTFVETLRQMAPVPANIGVFFSDRDALEWLPSR